MIFGEYERKISENVDFLFRYDIIKRARVVK